MSSSTPIGSLGWKAPSFRLRDLEGRFETLEDARGKNATLIVFICNHCPYVRGVIDRVVRDAKALAPLGITSLAINSNDAKQFPDDSFDNMKKFAKQHSLAFPYLFDETQEVARAYGAVCTPDFFGFNADLELQYRGRLDAGRKEAPPANAPRELYEAMKLVAKTGCGPHEQHASIGCSIKWR